MSSGLLGLGKNDPSKIHNKASIKILPEFKNRKVLQVACGDHHTLVLVQGSIFNLYDVSKVLTRWSNIINVNIEKKSDHINGRDETNDVFGWGENTCGQITGNSSLGFVEKPTIIKKFIGKNIKGIAACRASSMCYDDSGVVNYPIIIL